MISPAASANSIVSLRPAEADDARLLFDWLNQPESLAGKLDTVAPVAWDTHRAWFEARLSSCDCGIWIAEKNGQAIGQVRAERRDDGRLHVDIYVAAEARRRGAGAEILDQLAATCATRWPGEPLIARVLIGNTASLALFEGGGYRVQHEARDNVEMVKGG